MIQHLDSKQLKAALKRKEAKDLFIKSLNIQVEVEYILIKLADKYGITFKQAFQLYNMYWASIKWVMRKSKQLKYNVRINIFEHFTITVNNYKSIRGEYNQRVRSKINKRVLKRLREENEDVYNFLMEWKKQQRKKRKKVKF